MNMNRFAWYMNRLRSMSRAELSYRLTQRLKIEQERRSAGTAYRSMQPQLASAAISSFRNESAAHFFFAWADRARLSDELSIDGGERIQATCARADELLAHRIRLFSQTVDLGSEIDWQRDPITGNQWPQTFWADIDIRDGERVGGVKWVWELNRHHHLVTLAKAYFLTDNLRYAQEVCAQLESWLAQNPPGYGVHWTSALELALRVINWSWTLAFIRQAPPLSDALLSDVLQSMALQTRLIERRLSAHSSANNHLIGEAAALAIVGLSFPQFADADRWRRKGLSILEEELPRQIYADGAGAEQAPDYLAFIVDFNLHAWQLAARNEIEAPPIWLARLTAAANFLAHLMDASGNIPAIGDSDDAQVVPLSEAIDVNNLASIIRTAHRMQRRDPRNALPFDEKYFWLCAGQERQMSLAAEKHSAEGSAAEAKKVVGSALFAEGGYCALRAEESVAIFDCGPLGYLTTAAHGHADALSLTLSAAGTPLLIDPGTYAYQEGYAWRDYFRSTRAHNTLEIAHTDQSEMRGAFLWGGRATTRLLCWQSSDEFDLAIAEHDGYRERAIRHRRGILYLKPHWILVIDDLIHGGPIHPGLNDERVNDGKEHHVTQSWHFAPESTVVAETAGATVTNGQQSLRIVQPENTELKRQIVCGATDPIQGWASSGYGQLAEAPVLCVSGAVALPFRLATALCLESGLESERVEQEAITRIERARRAIDEELQ